MQWQLPAILTQQIVCGTFVVNQRENESLLYQRLIRQWDTDLRQPEEERHKIVLLEVEACLRRIAVSLTTSSTISEYPYDSSHKNSVHHVEQMIVFIAEHYMESLSVAQIAQQVHLNPNYAMSLFRKRVGTSIVDYITQYRIAHAQRLLVTTQANISEIALDCDFGSVSRFYVAFKSVCGVLPGEYRELFSTTHKMTT